MISVVMNEVERRVDSVIIRVTFIDDSGRGISRVRVQDDSGAVLVLEELPDCPRVYQSEPIEVLNDHMPVLGLSAACGEGGEGSGPEGYTNHTTLDPRVVIPVEPDENPCSEPLDVLERGDTPCAYGRDAVRGIAEEIEALCAEWNRYREDYQDHNRQRTAYTAAATALVVAAAACALVAAQLPWPVNWIVGIVAAALFVAALVTGTLAAYHAQEAERAQRSMEDAQARLDEARERYRAAVAEAIHACCGRVPAGIAVDPPECA